MFKVGELVTTLDNEGIGIVVEVKFANLLQYCKVLFAGETTPKWSLYTMLKEKQENGNY